MNSPNPPRSTPVNLVAVGLAWAAVGIPLAWGVFQTILKASALFR
jgi:hypothetical protein